MQELTCTLDEVDASSLALVGGKGANLGELVRAGMPVPRAFCITTAAYRAFLEASSLLGEIVRLLDGLDYEAPVEIERRAASIRGLLIRAPVPAPIEQAISTAYAQLEAELGPSVLVSVRSSATAEDLPGMSFAGQQDTYLNVGGVESVLEHAKRCWASLWTDRAIAYRHRQGFRARGRVPRRRRPGDVPVRGLGRAVHGEPGDVEPGRAVRQRELGPR